MATALTVAATVALVGCGGVDDVQPRYTVRPFEVDGESHEVYVFPAEIRLPRGTAVVVDESGDGLSGHAGDVAEDLVGAGFSVHVIPDGAALPGTRIADVAYAVAEHGAPLLVVGFGTAGPSTWRALEVLGSATSWGFLVSCALPEDALEFGRLMETGVRGIYALDGAVYDGSYLRSHLPMQNLETPHDFLVFDGVSDDFYDHRSEAFDDVGWEATRASLLEWLQVWSPTMEH